MPSRAQVEPRAGKGGQATQPGSRMLAGSGAAELATGRSAGSQRRADIPSPVQAPAASAQSFTSGALLPMPAILLPPAALRVPVTFAAVLIALALTGALSARLGGSNVRRAVTRVVLGGALGLAFTYCVGHLFGTAIH